MTELISFNEAFREAQATVLDGNKFMFPKRSEEPHSKLWGIRRN
jgi:hypothetical protein